MSSTLLLKTLTRFLPALAPAVVLSASLAVLDPATQLERQVGSAIANTQLADLAPLPASGMPAAIADASSIGSRVPEAGSEAFWLTRVTPAGPVAPVSWTAPVKPGDRILVREGRFGQRLLDVVAIEPEIAPAPTRIDTAVGAPDRFRLTLRDPAISGGAPVHLTIDADGRGITAVTGAGQAL